MVGIEDEHSPINGLQAPGTPEMSIQQVRHMVVCVLFVAFVNLNLDRPQAAGLAHLKRGGDVWGSPEGAQLVSDLRPLCSKALKS